MKEQDQVIELAKLDGWKLFREVEPSKYWQLSHNGQEIVLGVSDDWNEYKEFLPLYLHSRDAIVPLIEKHLRSGNYNRLDTINAFQELFGSPCNWQDIICATPSQLTEALLRALNLWKE